MIDLLELVSAAQGTYILTSRVLAMDETSIKAGRTQAGKMRTAYFWPVCQGRRETRPIGEPRPDQGRGSF